MCGRDCLNRVIRVFMLLLLPAVCHGATFNGVSYVASGDIVLGQWNGQFNKAKAYAAAKNIPLVVVWVNPGCGYCTSFEQNVMANSSVLSWMQSRRYVFVFAINGKTSDSGDAFTFVGAGNYPRARVAVPNGGASASFTARMSASAFMEKVDGVTGQSGSGGGSGSGSGGSSGSGSTAAKTYQLKLTASPTSGGTLSGAGSYVSGKTVTLTAKAASGYVFAGWYSGSTLKSQTTSYKVTTTSSASSLTGKFILKSADKITTLKCPLKTSYAKGTKIADVAVSVTATSLPTVKVSGLPTGLSYSSTTGKITGKPSRSGLFTAIATATTAGGARKAVTNAIVVRATGEWVLRLSSASDAGTVSGAGVYAVGKKASLRAKPNGSHVFLGWYDGSKCLSTDKSYSYVVTSADKTLTASFATVEEDAAAVKASVGGLSFDAAHLSRSTNVVCGVAVSWPVASSGLASTTVSVTGLPTGLSYSSKTGLVTGVPTRAQSKTVTVKVKTAGGTVVSHALAVTVQALPVWAYGTFDGGGTDGMLTMSVTSAGKVSGKYLSGGKTWTLSAKSYAKYDEKQGAFTVDVLAKNGKSVQTNRVTVTGNGESLLGKATCSRFTGWWNGWKKEPYATLAKEIDRATNVAYRVTSPTDGTITLSFGSSGTVTAKGSFVIGKQAKTGKDILYSVSCSTRLCRCDESNNVYVFVYFPPKANKFDGYCECLDLSFDGKNIFF